MNPPDGPGRRPARRAPSVAQGSDIAGARRAAYGYASLDRPGGTDEIRLRRLLAEYARLEGLELASVFVDRRDEPPYAFAAMRELLRRHGDVRAVLLPALAHVAQIPAVAHLSQAGLARYLGAAVLITGEPPPGGIDGHP